MNPYHELEGDDEDFEMPPRERKAIPAADLELLELAARAIGAARVELVDGENWVDLHFADESTVYHWNPLAHGDDALNLMTELQMLVDYSARGHKGTGDVTVACGFNIYVWESKKGDVSAATRRAITRTAAAIGKNR